MFIFCLFVIQFVPIETFCQFEISNGKHENSKSCYANCQAPNSDDPEEFVAEIREYPVYIGNSQETVKTKRIQIQVRPEYKYWELKLKPNCIPSVNDNCKLACVAGYEAEYIELDIIRNTKKLNSDEWEYKHVEIYEFEPSSIEDTLIEKEVLCDNLITEEFILLLKEKLTEAGFEPNTESTSFDTDVVNVLIRFQKANDLPIGQLDIDTLTELGLWE